MHKTFLIWRLMYNGIIIIAFEQGHTYHRLFSDVIEI